MEDGPVARTRRLVLGILLGAGLLLVPSAGAPLAVAGNPCYHGYDVPELTVGPGHDIKTEPCAFEPTITVINEGETVTFRNDGPEAHLVAGANTGWGDRDVQLGSGQSVAYTFAEPGVYPYACTLHPGMSGAIVVGDGGPALAAAFAAARGPGDAGGGTQAGAVTPAAAPATEAATPAAAPGSDPLVVATVAALAGAALALGAVLLAARTRTRRTASDPGTEPAARQVT
jgi:plastocyanin